ncbi:hypothetical protein [Leptospira noguchii]|uniref:hypothetical protein n=1 Tax=Leptospira noguchii TaxID=28182 RepID=UPI0009E58CA8
MGAKRTQHNAFLWVALWVVSHFNYEICERFAPIFLRRTHVNNIGFINSHFLIFKISVDLHK